MQPGARRPGARAGQDARGGESAQGQGTPHLPGGVQPTSHGTVTEPKDDGPSPVWREGSTCRGRWPQGRGATAALETQGQWLSLARAPQGPQGAVGVLGLSAREGGCAGSLRGSFCLRPLSLNAGAQEKQDQGSGQQGELRAKLRGECKGTETRAILLRDCAPEAEGSVATQQASGVPLPGMCAHTKEKGPSESNEPRPGLDEDRGRRPHSWPALDTVKGPSKSNEPHPWIGQGQGKEVTELARTGHGEGPLCRALSSGRLELGSDSSQSEAGSVAQPASSSAADEGAGGAAGLSYGGGSHCFCACLSPRPAAQAEAPPARAGTPGAAPS